MIAPTYMTTSEVSEFLRTPVPTLAYWRHVGKGPRSFKLGARVLYDQRDVLAYVERVQADTGSGDAA